MTLNITPYMSYIVVIVVAIGKWIKPWFEGKTFGKKNLPSTKLLTPILLTLSVLLGYLFGTLIYKTPVGEALIQGLVSGIITEWGYDSVKSFMSKGKDA